MKRDGLGIGEAGRVVPDPLSELEAEHIIEAQERAEMEAYLADEHLCLDCGKPISRRLLMTHTPGCAVMCEACWVNYWIQEIGLHPKVETFEGVLEELHKRLETEQQRPKRCYICGSPDAQMNSGAGIDLCEKHWDCY